VPVSLPFIKHHQGMSDKAPGQPGQQGLPQSNSNTPENQQLMAPFGVF
jgi:hypothetical protein